MEEPGKARPEGTEAGNRGSPVGGRGTAGPKGPGTRELRVRGTQGAGVGTAEEDVAAGRPGTWATCPREPWGRPGRGRREERRSRGVRQGRNPGVVRQGGNVL